MNQSVTQSPTKSKVYVIYGSPIPLARARMFKQKVYDPQREKKLVSSISIASQHNDQPMMIGPLHLDATFYVKYPTSISKKRQLEYQGKYHATTPDLDNYIKYIGDVCTGLVYHNDCIISSITAKKVYDANERTEFYFTELV